MNSFEYSLNDDLEKKLENDYKLPIKTKILFGIFFSLVIIFLIVIIFVIKIYYSDLEGSINQINDDKKRIKENLDEIKFNILKNEELDKNNIEELKLQIIKNNNNNEKLKLLI